MRLFLKIIGVIILVAAIAVGASILLLPKDRIISEVKNAFLQETGRTLDFDEDVSLSFYPNAGIIIKDVKLSDAEWAGADPMLTVGEAEVLLAVKPLFNKEVVIQRFILKEPVIRLRVAEDGRANWEFKTRESGVEPATDSANATESLNSQPSARRVNVTSSQLKPNLIEIVDGQILYENAKKDVTEKISNIDLLIDMPDLAGEAEIEGNLTLRDEAVEIKAVLQNLSALLEGQKTPAKIQISSDPFDLNFKGDYSPKDKYLMEGTLQTEVRSMTQLAKMAHLDMKKITLPFDSFVLRMQGQAGLDDLSYDAFNFRADGINVSGKGRAIFSIDKPFFGGTYNFDHIDIDRFLAAAELTPQQAESITSDKGDQKAGPLADSGNKWSSKPIDYTFLKTVNLNVVANVDKYTYDGISFGPNTLQLEIKDDTMEVNVSDTPIFGGKLNTTTILDTSVKPATIRINAKAKGVEAKEMFSYLADYDRLSGKMDATLFNVTAHATSLKTIADTMDGTVDFIFKDGQIRGVNVVEWAKAFQKKYANINPSFEATPFVSLGGTFNIADGVAHNYDLRMKGPLANASGNGIVNIGQKTIKYDLKLTLLQKAEGVPSGITMPFTATGYWSDPKIRPDISNLIQNIIKNPQNPDAELKNLKETGKALEDQLNANENVKAIKDLIKSF